MAESTDQKASDDSNRPPWRSPGRMASLACLMEVTAPKPGNVHRGADFEDVRFSDFTTSAVVIGGVFDDQIDRPLGELVLAAVEATRHAVGTNTNLGLILLLAPLAKASRLATNRQLSSADVKAILDQLTSEDGAQVFRAIATAKPGGLGNVDEMDVQTQQGNIDLLAAMRLSQNHDSIAAQFVTNFSDIFLTGQALLRTGMECFQDLDQAIVFAHVALIAIQGDSLIARKCGEAINQQAKDRAASSLQPLGFQMESWRDFAAIDSNQPLSQQTPLNCDPHSLEQFWTQVGAFDFWLRSDGHRRNPGTTADLIGASLFVALHNRLISFPLTRRP